MKKIIAPLLIGAALSSAFAADDSLKQEVEALKAQMAELKNAQAKLNVDALRAQVSEIKAHDAGDNIKWNVDFRTAYDIVDYKMQTPTGASTSTDNGIWTNIKIYYLYSGFNLYDNTDSKEKGNNQRQEY